MDYHIHEPTGRAYKGKAKSRKRSEYPRWCCMVRGVDVVAIYRRTAADRYDAWNAGTGARIMRGGFADLVEESWDNYPRMNERHARDLIEEAGGIVDD